jgi:hypothetical protein
VQAVALAHDHRSSPSGRIEDVDGALTGVIRFRWRVVEVVDSHGAVSVPSALGAQIGFSDDGYVFGKDTVNARCRAITSSRLAATASETVPRRCYLTVWTRIVNA